MKNKKIIFSIVIIIFIILLIIVINIIKNNTYKDEEDGVAEEVQEYIDSITNRLRKVTNIIELKKAEVNLYLFYNNYLNFNSSKNIILNILSSEYVNEKGLNEQNLENIIPEFNDINIEIDEIYILKNEYNVESFFTKGIIRDRINNKYKEFNVVISFDDNNETYCVDLNGYDFSQLNVGDEIDYIVPDEIRKNEFNALRNVSYSYEELASEKMSMIKYWIVNDVDRAYNLLSEEAKEKYKTIDEFRSFIEENKSKLFLMLYSSYEMKMQDDNLIIYAYDKKSIICIKIYFDDFSKYTYDIEMI